MLEDPSLELLADRSNGFSGAEVELLCRRVRWAQRQNGADLRDGLEKLVAEVRPVAAAPTVGFRRKKND